MDVFQNQRFILTPFPLPLSCKSNKPQKFATKPIYGEISKFKKSPKNTLRITKLRADENDEMRC